MGAKWRIAAVVGASLVIVGAVAPLAGANGPMGGIEDVIMSVPSQGDGVATRAPMPADSTTGTVGVTATSDDPDFVKGMTEMLSEAPTLNTRVLTCVFLNTLLTRTYGESEDFSINEPTLQLLFMYTCIRIALDMQQAQGGAAPRLPSVLAAGCSQLPVAAPVHITKTANGYTATVSGASSKGKPKFRATCKRTRKGLQTTVRSASRNGKLAKAVGPILSVGFASSSSSPGKLKIALGVR